MSKSQNIFIIAVLVAAMSFVGPHLFAQEDTQDLNKRIKELESRILDLEQQLDDRSLKKGPVMPGVPRRGVWDPFAEMEQMQREMNRMFDDRFWRGMGEQGGLALPENVFDPQIDIKEEGDHYLLRMDIPGMDKSKIDVRIENRVLKVSGQRESENEESTPDKFYRRERSFGYFSRSVPLPEDIKEDSVEAKYENGVLKVKIGRQKQQRDATSKKIDIK